MSQNNNTLSRKNDSTSFKMGSMGTTYLEKFSKIQQSWIFNPKTTITTTTATTTTPTNTITTAASTATATTRGSMAQDPSKVRGSGRGKQPSHPTPRTIPSSRKQSLSRLQRSTASTAAKNVNNISNSNSNRFSGGSQSRSRSGTPSFRSSGRERTPPISMEKLSRRQRDQAKARQRAQLKARRRVSSLHHSHHRGQQHRHQHNQQPQRHQHHPPQHHHHHHHQSHPLGVGAPTGPPTNPFNAPPLGAQVPQLNVANPPLRPPTNPNPNSNTFSPPRTQYIGAMSSQLQQIITGIQSVQCPEYRPTNRNDNMKEKNLKIQNGQHQLQQYQQNLLQYHQQEARQLQQQEQQLQFIQRSSVQQLQDNAQLKELVMAISGDNDDTKEKGKTTGDNYNELLLLTNVPSLLNMQKCLQIWIY